MRDRVGEKSGGNECSSLNYEGREVSVRPFNNGKEHAGDVRACAGGQAAHMVFECASELGGRRVPILL